MPTTTVRSKTTLGASVFVVTLFCLSACDPPPVPIAETPEGKLCGRAYGSTVDSLRDLYAHAGRDLPPLQSKADYIDRCVSFHFTPEQLRCLDPKLSIADRTCVDTLEGVKASATKLRNKLIQTSPKDGNK